ncbi:MAG: hypothetical protein ACRYG2_31925 [Janthinobacterium lividum]
MSENEELRWFAVRCVFRSGWASGDGPPLFEERITLWRATSVEEAVRRAEAEAEVYAGTIDEAPDTFLGLAQAYQLFAEPGDGAEVFSLLRESGLSAEDYLETFFDTGGERSREL